MNRQKEIREKLAVIASRLCTFGGCTAECENCKGALECADLALSYLHDNDVVIKLESGRDLTGCVIARLESLIKDDV